MARPAYLIVVKQIGIEDAVHGQNVHAYVSFKSGFDVPTVPELIVFARERVGYKAPEVLQVLPSLPLNAVGKINLWPFMP